MNEHKLCCTTCKKKYGSYNYDEVDGGSFYVTDEGLMFCNIDDKPIKFSEYIRTFTHGCASHSYVDMIEQLEEIRREEREMVLDEILEEMVDVDAWGEKKTGYLIVDDDVKAIIQRKKKELRQQKEQTKKGGNSKMIEQPDIVIRATIIIMMFISVILLFFGMSTNQNQYLWYCGIFLFFAFTIGLGTYDIPVLEKEE